MLTVIQGGADQPHHMILTTDDIMYYVVTSQWLSGFQIIVSTIYRKCALIGQIVSEVIRKVAVRESKIEHSFLNVM